MGLSVYKQGLCTRESIFQQHVAGSVYVGDLTDPGNITGDSAEQLPVFKAFRVFLRHFTDFISKAFGRTDVNVYYIYIESGTRGFSLRGF